ncbi:glutamate racemase [Paenibacillus doosanensis]|uniref:Glutamate racemase n=1 Tax=Paenibacillus konkukensis TaxID=2020716 RepID=A0ABY4RLP4_9BACL|nr:MULTISPECIES: glutamate racemase [Paenibacillus]MCS7463017.1 glutamate racemase [Paenibacillus doosanensis]UQZ83058.1 Glutamate racemase 2 [Paenibacillus konkukensis]
MKIAFFDSGLGGLTVLSEAMNQLPHEDFLYFADTLHVPYGPKPKDEVRKYILDSIDSIIHEEIKAIVIACNTATSLTIQELRGLYDIPIIGMEPAVKPAVEMNRSTGKRVLVFATPLTLKQSKYNDLVSRIDNLHIVDSLPLPELVEYCEALCFDKTIISDYFLGKLAPFNLDDYGTIVLGCTHYPFYRSLLRELLPDHIRIVDGSAGTVKRLIQVLSEREMTSLNGSCRIKFLNSSGSAEYTDKMKRALGLLRNE